MLVRDVVIHKDRRVVAIDSDATVSEAIAKLVQNNIGSLPVVDPAGQLIGIISERDILRVIHGRGDGFGRLPIAELMTGHPVTCHLEEDVNDVMGKMSDRHIAKVPVVNDSELVGIVSVGDVIKVLYEQVNTENQHLISYIQGAV